MAAMAMGDGMLLLRTGEGSFDMDDANAAAVATDFCFFLSADGSLPWLAPPLLPPLSLSRDRMVCLTLF